MTPAEHAEQRARDYVRRAVPFVINIEEIRGAA